MPSGVRSGYHSVAGMTTRPLDVLPDGLGRAVRRGLVGYLKTDVFECVSVTRRGTEDSVLGFLSDYARVAVGYEIDGRRDSVDFFIKSFPDDVGKAAFNNEIGTFQKETVMYRDVFRRLDSTNADSEWHPKCYSVRDNVFVMEDLTEKGYRMHPVRVAFDEAHCLAGLRSLARMHSASALYEEKQSVTLGRAYRLTEDCGDLLSNSFMTYPEWTKVCAIASIEEMTAKHPQYGKRTETVRGVKGAFKRALDTLYKPSRLRSTLVHMDPWSNNMLFKYDRTGQPERCVLVDYQGSIYRPSVVDVASFLKINADPDQLEKNKERLLRYYFEEFRACLVGEDVDPAAFLGDWEGFRRSYEEYKIWGLVHALILYPFILLDNDLVLADDSFKTLSKNSRARLLERSLSDQPKLKQRVYSVLEEFIEKYVVTKG